MKYQPPSRKIIHLLHSPISHKPHYTTTSTTKSMNPLSERFIRIFRVNLQMFTLLTK